MYYTYMLRCKDGSIYTGITTDLKRRFNEHLTKSEKCAKYTFNHDVIKIECAWSSKSRKDASKLEYHLKRLKKLDKENIILNKESIYELLSEKIEDELYKKIENINEIV